MGSWTKATSQIRKIKKNEFNVEKWMDDQLRNGQYIRYERFKLENAILPRTESEIRRYFPEEQEGDEIFITEWQLETPLTDEELLVARAKSEELIKGKVVYKF